MNIQNHRLRRMGERIRPLAKAAKVSKPIAVAPSLSAAAKVWTIKPCLGTTLEAHISSLVSTLYHSEENCIVVGTHSTIELIPTELGYSNVVTLFNTPCRNIMNYGTVLTQLYSSGAITELTYGFLNRILKPIVAEWFKYYIGSSITINGTFLEGLSNLKSVIDKIVDESYLSKDTIAKAFRTHGNSLITIHENENTLYYSQLRNSLKGIGIERVGKEVHQRVRDTVYKLDEDLILATIDTVTVAIPESLSELKFDKTTKSFDTNSLTESTALAITSLKLDSPTRIVTRDGTSLKLWTWGEPDIFGRLTHSL